MMPRTPPGQVHDLALRVAAGSSVRAAAKAVGIADRTSRDVVKTAEYLSVYNDARREIAQRVVNSVSNLNTKAVRRLGKLVASKDDETALRAVKIALDCQVPFQALAHVADWTAAVEANE